jgi:hypothetical protein
MLRCGCDALTAQAGLKGLSEGSMGRVVETLELDASRVEILQRLSAIEDTFRSSSTNKFSGLAEIVTE